MATTPAERKALLFLGAVISLGVGARVVTQVRGGGDRVGPMQPALERQLARAEAAARRARAEREAREAGKKEKKAAKGRGAGARGNGAKAARDSSAPRGPVDIDTADSIALATLPGVGPSLARRIIDDRRMHGPFGGVEALDRVPGVGPRLLERLAPHVTFSGPRRPILGTGKPSPVDRSHPASRQGRAAAPNPGALARPRSASLHRARIPMAAPVAISAERIGELLVREGLISKEQLQKALEESRTTGTRVGYNLVKLGFIPETELTRMLARQYRMPAVDLSKFEVDPRIAKLIPTDLATKHLVLPLKRDGRTLTVAMADPTNLGVIDDLKFITRYDIFPVIAGEYTLRAAVEKYYDSQDQQMQTLLADIAGLGDDDAEVVNDQEEEMSAAALAAAVDDAPVVKLLNAILTDAVKRGASDIHFECFEHELRVRYRIDGALQEVMKPPMKLKAALISRFKIMSSLNIAERRVPQDGRIKLKMGKKVIDYRVSTLPTLFGEKVVLRILNKDNLTLDLAKFGIEPRAERELMEAIKNPYGMVLVTGPTGSGKTTTLYSALSQINTIDTNIMTAEDPVEYNLYGINQVLVRNEIGMTFAAALKAFLRQDPNIIMLGEIRDLETGGIAVKAALTGHLVLSTLHTNSAPETVTRLLDMGLEPFNVASALNLVLAQRLIRRVCSNCITKYDPSDEEFAGAKVARETTMRELRFTEEALRDARNTATKQALPFLQNLSLDTRIGELPFFKGAGCDTCAGIGLKGRQGLYEVMFMTPRVRRLILQNVGAAEIKDGAIEDGMLTLRMDGWLKILKGITTMEQVVRETSA